MATISDVEYEAGLLAMGKSRYLSHNLLQALLSKDVLLIGEVVRWLSIQKEAFDNDNHADWVFDYTGAPDHYELLAEAFLSIGVRDTITIFRSILFPAIEEAIGYCPDT